MKSINDAFFESSRRIFAHLNRVDLYEHNANSVVRYVVLCKGAAADGATVGLGSHAKRPLDSIRPVLFCCGYLVVDEERVHFRPQSKEVGDRLADRLVLEYANHFLLGRVEEWARLSNEAN